MTAIYIITCLYRRLKSKLTYEIGLLQGLSEGGRKNIAGFVGICTTVCTDSNDRGIRVLAIGTLDIPCGPFAINCRLVFKIRTG